MSALAELFAGRPSAADQPRVATVREGACADAGSRVSSLRHEQIQALVQQLFFRCDSPPVRRVGFAAADAPTGTAELCLRTARVLAEAGGYDIGLIDASVSSAPLHSQLEIPAGGRSEAAWQIATRLWLVPRQSWLDDDASQRVSDESLSRLRHLMAEFDFSVLCCAPVSWSTFRIGRACDGLVLVLAANRTRRVVAAEIGDQLQRAQVHLLGTVLTERRFPVPQGLYRSL
jgi:Mrp family chromosome partitioning ATPase